VVNSTISGNNADEGGGLRIFSGSLVNTTVTKNTAVTTAGILVNIGTVNLTNVISSNNTSADTATADFAGNVSSSGGNIIANTTATGFIQWLIFLVYRPCLAT